MSKISDMETTIQTIKGDNEELIKENLSLKRHLGGYKTSNDNYKKQVKELKALVEHYKALDLEGDGLYEKKIAELESKNVLFEQLQKRFQAITIEKKELEEKVSSQTSIIKELEETVKDLSKPWWKRIF